MEAPVTLEDLEVVVRHRNGRYLAKIPHIGLYATAESLPKAIEALEAKKKSLREELEQAGMIPGDGVPATRAMNRHRAICEDVACINE